MGFALVLIMLTISRYIKKQYDNPKVMITENGWGDRGELNDQDRINYLRGHLQEIMDVVLTNECDVVGYSGEIIE